MLKNRLYIIFWEVGAYFGWVATWVVNAERHSRKMILLDSDLVP